MAGMDHLMSQYPIDDSYATSSELIAEAYAAAARIPDPVKREQSIRQLHGMVELSRNLLNDPLSKLQSIQMELLSREIERKIWDEE